MVEYNGIVGDTCSDAFHGPGSETLFYLVVRSKDEEMNHKDPDERSDAVGMHRSRMWRNCLPEPEEPTTTVKVMVIR